MKSLKANILCLFGIALGCVSVLCGDAIQGSVGIPQVIGWVLLSFGCLGAALVLCALGVSSENERIENQKRKINRVAHHTNEWRDTQ